MPENASPFQRNDPSVALGARAKEACADSRRSAIALDRTVPPEKICEDLHMAVERAAAKSIDSMSSLEKAVRRFTVALKDDGASPEAILIALKSVINARTFPVGDGNLSGVDLRQQISTWSIKEFFAEEKA